MLIDDLNELRALGAGAGALFTALSYPCGFIFEWTTGAKEMTEEAAGGFRDSAAIFLSVITASTAASTTFYSARMKRVPVRPKRAREELRSLHVGRFCSYVVTVTMALLCLLLLSAWQPEKERGRDDLTDLPCAARVLEALHPLRGGSTKEGAGAAASEWSEIASQCGRADVAYILNHHIQYLCGATLCAIFIYFLYSSTVDARIYLRTRIPDAPPESAESPEPPRIPAVPRSPGETAPPREANSAEEPAEGDRARAGCS